MREEVERKRMREEVERMREEVERKRKERIFPNHLMYVRNLTSHPDRKLIQPLHCPIKRVPMAGVAILTCHVKPKPTPRPPEGSLGRSESGG